MNWTILILILEKVILFRNYQFGCLNLKDIFKNKVTKKIHRKFYGEFRFDSNTKFDKSIIKILIGNNIWFLGYYQSPQYFLNYQKQILNDLKPPEPEEKHFKKLGKLIGECNSVALGIRLYEKVKILILMQKMESLKH